MLSPFLLVLVLVACTNDTSHRVEYLEVDGIPLVRTVGSPKYDGQLFNVSRDLVIGVDEGEPEWQMFGFIGSYLVTSDGRMVLLDSQRYEVFIVSESGSLIARVGRQGAGPGEFLNPLYLYWYESDREFWVADDSTSRMTRFNLEGEYLDSFNYSNQRTQWRNLLSLGNGRFVGWEMDRTTTGGRIHNYSYLDSNLEWTTSFLEITENFVFRLSPTSSGYQIPFTYRPNLSVGLSGLVLSYHPGIGRITLYEPPGNQVLHIECEWGQVPIPQEERDQARSSIADDGNPESQRIARAIPIPDTRPGLLRATTDGIDRIWVTKPSLIDPGTEERTHFYDIISREGIWLGIQESVLPLSMIRGHYAYRRTTSPAGAPRFERYSLSLIIDELRRNK